jgi:ABC-type branched-subunit amino acid transport system permease subunit
VFPFFANKYLLTVVILGLIYVLLGLGLNIVVGLAGLLDLGYVAFYAIGAYGLALGYQYLGWASGRAAAGGHRRGWRGASSVSRCCAAR